MSPEEFSIKSCLNSFDGSTLRQSSVQAGSEQVTGIFFSHEKTQKTQRKINHEFTQMDTNSLGAGCLS
jgi:hypothetical protein